MQNAKCVCEREKLIQDIFQKNNEKENSQGAKKNPQGRQERGKRAADLGSLFVKFDAAK